MQNKKKQHIFPKSSQIRIRHCSKYSTKVSSSLNVPYKVPVNGESKILMIQF